jgi:hypothetical protein
MPANEAARAARTKDAFILLMSKELKRFEGIDAGKLNR